MRVVSILAIVAMIARFTDCKPLGTLVLWFILGCALYGLAQGGTFNVTEQRKRHWRENPEAAVAGFQAWKINREARRRSRPGYVEQKAEMDRLIQNLNTKK